MGPLILATATGLPTLSLFARGCAPPSRDGTIAFRMTGAMFVEFAQGAAEHGLTHKDGTPLGLGHVVDHDLSWSVYFSDPDGNRLEVTTYDYAEVAQALAELGVGDDQ